MASQSGRQKALLLKDIATMYMQIHLSGHVYYDPNLYDRDPRTADFANMGSPPLFGELLLVNCNST